MFIDIVQDREKDYQQLFIKIDLSFLINRIKINSLLSLYNSISCRYGTGPINFVVSSMDVA